MTRKDVVFAVLGAFFLTNALIAEMIGGKLIYVGTEGWRLGPLGPFAMSVGIIPWPVVFVATDLINEYFGRRGVRRLTLLTVGMIAYAYLVLWGTMSVRSTSFSPVDDASYNRVFGQSRWIIIGSMTAFLVSQVVDVLVFHLVRRQTGGALLWLRSTGSTVISQVVDSVVVLYIGLAIPQHWDLRKFLSVALPNYTVKLAIAVLMTPAIYIVHGIVERYLGKEYAHALAEQAAAASEGRLPSPPPSTPEADWRD
ncbi:MAG: queuosine precursor transporter [Planctomycetota bacterium]